MGRGGGGGGGVTDAAMLHMVKCKRYTMQGKYMVHENSLALFMYNKVCMETGLVLLKQVIINALCVCVC